MNETAIVDAKTGQKAESTTRTFVRGGRTVPNPETLRPTANSLQIQSTRPTLSITQAIMDFLSSDNDVYTGNTACGFCCQSPVGPRTVQHLSITGDEEDDTAKDLMELDAVHRCRIFDEIHGVAPALEESPQYIEKCLLELEEEIEKITDGRRSCYDEAINLNPDLVKSHNFRLMFLRSTRFDPAKAAALIARHFKYKAILFGKEKLVKRITLDDFDDDDMAALMAGAVQLLPECDSAGRGVIIIARHHSRCKTWKNQLRVHWYFIQAALEDETMQRNGLIYVVYDVGEKVATSNTTMGILRNVHLVSEGLPHRVICFHYLSDNPAVRSVLSLFRKVGGARFRLRFRAHSGKNATGEQRC